MSTGPVELQGITIVAPVKATLQGLDYRRNILKGVTIAVGTGAQIMQLKVVDRNHEPIEGATCRVLNAIGGSNNVLSFDGGNDYVLIPNPTTPIITGNFTISMWLFPTQIKASGIMFKASAYNAANTDFYIYHWGNTNGLQIGTSNGTTFRALNTGAVGLLALNTWQNLTVIKNGTNILVYLNFNLIATLTAYPTGIQNTKNITLGYSQPSNNYFKGIISDVRVFNTAKSIVNIEAESTARLKGDEAGLTEYWKLDEGTGTLVNGLTNNGTIFGATWAEVEDLPILNFKGQFDTITPYDSQTTNANGLTTLNYQIDKIHGLEVTLPGKRRFIMPFERTIRGLLDWQVMLSDYLATFATDRGNILINSEPENNDANFLIS